MLIDALGVITYFMLCWAFVSYEGNTDLALRANCQLLRIYTFEETESLVWAKLTRRRAERRNMFPCCMLHRVGSAFLPALSPIQALQPACACIPDCLVD